MRTALLALLLALPAAGCLAATSPAPAGDPAPAEAGAAAPWESGLDVALAVRGSRPVTFWVTITKDGSKVTDTWTLEGGTSKVWEFAITDPAAKVTLDFKWRPGRPPFLPVHVNTAEGSATDAFTFEACPTGVRQRFDLVTEVWGSAPPVHDTGMSQGQSTDIQVVYCG